MEFTQKMSFEAATEEISKLLDQKKIFPKRREQIQVGIDAVAEAMQYGYVVIEADGRIVQTLVTPVGEVTQVTYAARVSPDAISKQLGALKVYNQPNVSMVYMKAYTNLMEPTIHKMEPTDRNTAEAITLFFQ